MIQVCESCKQRFPRLHLVAVGEEGSRCEVCGATVHRQGEHLATLPSSTDEPRLPRPPRPAEPLRPAPMDGDGSSLRLGGLADELAAGSLEPDVLPLGTNAGPTLRPVALEPGELPPPAAPPPRPARRLQRHHAIGLAGAVLALGVGALLFVGRTDSSDQLTPGAQPPPTPIRDSYHVGDVPAALGPAEPSASPSASPARSAFPEASAPVPPPPPGRPVVPLGTTPPR